MLEARTARLAARSIDSRNERAGARVARGSVTWFQSGGYRDAPTLRAAGGCHRERHLRVQPTSCRREPRGLLLLSSFRPARTRNGRRGLGSAVLHRCVSRELSVLRKAGAGRRDGFRLPHLRIVRNGGQRKTRVGTWLGRGAPNPVTNPKVFRTRSCPMRLAFESEPPCRTKKRAALTVPRSSRVPTAPLRERLTPRGQAAL